MLFHYHSSVYILLSQLRFNSDAIEQLIYGFAVTAYLQLHHDSSYYILLPQLKHSFAVAVYMLFDCHSSDSNGTALVIYVTVYMMVLCHNSNYPLVSHLRLTLRSQLRFYSSVTACISFFCHSLVFFCHGLYVATLSCLVMLLQFRHCWDIAAYILIPCRVTRLGEILPFGRFFMALGKFFSRKNRPMIWAKF
jgi:hypothetical protein